MATLKPSEQSMVMLEKAKDHIRALKGSQHRRVTGTEALDWLLQDMVNHGSPVAKAWAQEVWPERIGVD